ILSDFLDENYEKQLRLLAQKHDVIALQVLDDAEIELPDAGVLNLTDPESGFDLYINTSLPSLRKSYAAQVKLRQEKLAATLKQMKIDHLLIRNTDSYVDALRDFFEKRKRQIRGRR
ncbi:MAG: DUF58 domain-containing protein, partial [Candidatus Cloacimonadaceae bacterium]|nr:DUF58 domain-containing protein [Candidatus Cloacimonadaceae bacterium]